MWISDLWNDYELVDCGEGEKLERWGNHLLCRPEPQAVWQKAEDAPWQKAEAVYHRSSTGGGQWEYKKPLPDSWAIGYKNLRFIVRPTGFKHTGIFPEQADNWDFMSEIIRSAKRSVSVLNLFAYTGGATMACLEAGAAVTHVDAAKGIVSWAKENAALNSLADRPVRYIVDDCKKFVEREIRRGKKYDGIVMDPPSYGRGPDGQMFRFEDDVRGLIASAEQLLSDDALFFVLNSYTSGFAPQIGGNLLIRTISRRRGGSVKSDNIGLRTRHGLMLPCGSCARWLP